MKITKFKGSICKICFKKTQYFLTNINQIYCICKTQCLLTYCSMNLWIHQLFSCPLLLWKQLFIEAVSYLVFVVLTFTAGLGLVPGPIFSAAQNAVSRGFHQVTRVTAVGHRVVEGKLTS